MELGFLLTISCVMTTISMLIFVGVIIFFARFGGQGVKALIDRFTGGGDDSNAAKPQTNPSQGQSPAVASSQSLRMRAQQLNFPAPAAGAGAAFGAQSASGNYPDFPPPQNASFPQSQQASLTPRSQGLGFDAKSAPLGLANSFQPSTPSLSPSRPFQEGSQFNPNQGQARLNQQQQNFGQQPLSGNAPQQGFNAPNQQQNFGQQPLSGNAPQQGFGAQNAPQSPPPFDGLGQNRPPLRSVPRPGNTQYDRPIGGRDSRKGDDRDYIYDEGNLRGGGFMDDVGDFLDNV